MPVQIEISGLKELQAKLSAFPGKFQALMLEAIKASMLVLQENVPPYPRQNPDSKYTRTGNLGASIGSGMQGGAVGKADIQEARKVGSSFVGTFGTKIEYAPHVIGTSTQSNAARKAGWYTFLTIAKASAQKIGMVFADMTARILRFLN